MCPVQDRYSRFEEDQREFFNQLITKDWETYRSSDWDYVRDFEVRQLFAYIGVPERILDVGCGCGYHDYAMAEYEAVQRVVAIDYSEESIRKANGHYGHPNVERLVADMFKFDKYSDFDLVISFQVIEHLSRPVEFLTCCARLAKRGGWVAIFTPNRLRLRNRLLQIFERKPEMEDVMHFREYSPAELVAMGKTIGLEFYKLFGCEFEVALKSIQIPRDIRLRIHLGKFLPGLANRLAVIFKIP